MDWVSTLVNKRVVENRRESAKGGKTGGWGSKKLLVKKRMKRWSENAERGRKETWYKSGVTAASILPIVIVPAVCLPTSSFRTCVRHVWRFLIVFDYFHSYFRLPVYCLL
mmetsp:Transcript_31114/g.81657  ORF Transcript_31114/g.81657 Transcript_31114/m.81657 type:complete len:110 (-) Transcript_31114:326-655(-)